MTVLRCPDCDVHIEWMVTRHGRRLPFNYHPIPVTEDSAGAGWAPGFWVIRGRRKVAMATWADYPEVKQRALSRVVLLHDCPRYEARIREVLDGARVPAE